MARRSLIVKEQRRAKLVSLKKEKRAELKKIILDMKKSDEERMNAVDALNKLRKNTSRVRLRNRCQWTGRSRGFLRKFKLSRLCFREKASSGYIPGIFKASW